jgi:hypothetical protein
LETLFFCTRQVGRVVITSASGALLCYVFDKINTAGLEYSNLGERAAHQDSADQSSAGSNSA